MVMQIGADVETSLKLTMTYDDNSSSTKVFSVGDFISVDFNKDGLRRTVCGTVNAIHADPYNGRLSRKDWYIVLHSDSRTKQECGFVGALKIRVLEMIDLTVLSRAKQINYVNSPNDETNITDIRFFEDKFQISQNDGASWITIGVAVEKEKQDAQNDLIKKISEMIAADREGVTDQLIAAIAALIDGETAKELWLRRKPHHHHHKKDRPEDLIAKLTALIDKLEDDGTEESDPTPAADPMAEKARKIDELIAKLAELIDKAKNNTDPVDPDPAQDPDPAVDPDPVVDPVDPDNGEGGDDNNDPDPSVTPDPIDNP